jgi:hypothetical protein
VTTEEQPDEETPRFERGGFIEPGDGDDYTRTGCGIKGYCPTHDGRVLTIRDGRLKDVTDEAIEARMPREP